MNVELQVMLTPAAGWRRAVKEDSSHWLARPLFFLLVFGCTASLSVSGRVTARLALPSAIWMSFIPVVQAASLALVCRGKLPLRRAVGLFALGNTPWILLLIAFTATWGFAPGAAVYANFGVWEFAFFGVLAWSAWIDFHFFRVVTGRTPAPALFALVAQRLLCWSAGLAIFVGPSAVQVVEGWFVG